MAGLADVVASLDDLRAVIESAAAAVLSDVDLLVKGGTGAGRAGGGPSPGGGGGGGASAVSVVSTALSTLAGGPIAAAMGVFTELTGVMKTFVGALNPAAVMMFDQAFRNVQATIGQVFLPVIQILTSSLQDVASILNGPMQELAPVMGQLAAVLASVLVPAAQQVGAVLGLLTPLLGMVSTLLEPLADIIRVNAAMMVAWSEVLKTAFGALKPVVDAVVNVLKEMVRGVVTFTAYLTKWVAGNAALDRMIAALQQQADPGRVQNAAPQNVGIKGLEQITKDLAAAAGLAGAGGAEKVQTADQSLIELVNLFRSAKDDNRDWQTVVKGWIEHELPEAIVRAIKSVGAAASNVVDNAKGAAGIQKDSAADIAVDALTGRAQREFILSHLP
jgi:hypothetical protein